MGESKEEMELAAHKEGTADVNVLLAMKFLALGIMQDRYSMQDMGRVELIVVEIHTLM